MYQQLSVPSMGIIKEPSKPKGRYICHIWNSFSSLNISAMDALLTYSILWLFLCRLNIFSVIYFSQNIWLIVNPELFLSRSYFWKLFSWERSLTNRFVQILISVSWEQYKTPFLGPFPCPLFAAGSCT